MHQFLLVKLVKIDLPAVRCTWCTSILQTTRSTVRTMERKFQTGAVKFLLWVTIVGWRSQPSNTPLALTWARSHIWTVYCCKRIACYWSWESDKGYPTKNIIFVRAARAIVSNKTQRALGRSVFSFFLRGIGKGTFLGFGVRELISWSVEFEGFLQ